MTRRPTTHPSRILVVEDEATLAEVLADNLSAEGFDVQVASDGLAALQRWREARPDLVVLDVMLPHKSGFEICREMREAGDTTPVLFLSARSQAEDRVTGLKVGGDDYLSKPFHLPEFLLRVKAMLRRKAWGSPARSEANYTFGGHRIDFRSWTATLVGGRVETLREREVGLLKLFARRAGEVVSRDEILDEVWGDDAFPSSRTIDNLVVRLRKLFEPDPTEPIYFHTVWGVGYKFTPEGRPAPSKV